MQINIDDYEPYDYMNVELWTKVQHFTYDEEWGDPYKMWVHLIYFLDAFRESISPHQLIIHGGWELRDSGWHPAGAAADLHCPTIPYKELAYLAMQFPFTGIGLYPFWNNPGLHLDVRLRPEDCKRKVWFKNRSGQYWNVNSFDGLVEL